jgi:hypothetical protein
MLALLNGHTEQGMNLLEAMMEAFVVSFILP